MTSISASSRRCDEFSDVHSREFAAMLSQLRTTAAAFKGAAAEAAGSFAENRQEADAAAIGALEAAFALYGRCQDLARTLLTISRVHLGLNGADTSAVSAKTTVASIERAVKRDAEPLLTALCAIERIDPDFGGSAALARWAGHAKRLLSDPERRTEIERLKSEVVMPAAAVYTHLTATMSVEISGSDGRVRRAGFGECTAMLKNADDPALRRTSFLALNAWLAGHAPCFLDALNAVLGFRICVFGKDPDAVFRHSLSRERTDPKILEAMFGALDAHLETARKSVTLRQRAFGPGPMALSNVLAPAPLAFVAQDRSFEAASADHLRALEPLSPGFAAFLRRAIDSGWIDVRRYSRKSANWCDDLPAVDSVRVLANYVPTLAGEASLAHLLGAAYQMQVLHQGSASDRPSSIAATELAANFCETAVFESLAREAKSAWQREALAGMQAGEPGRAAEKTRSARAAFFGVLWQSLRRLTNCLLVIPARHRLLRSLFEARAKGAVSLSQAIELCEASWLRSFGGVTTGEERYVWAYKHHFYRIDPIFYDWQYTAGFLLSEALLARMKSSGASFSGASLEAAWLDSGRLSTADFGRRHLGADLTQPDFWHGVLEAALAPVAEAESFLAHAGALPPK